MAKTTTARDTSIATYRAQRDFGRTREPAPGAPRPSSDSVIFVVQKHRAHRAGLHWDFRLEHGGVLWSWAVRKGPSLDPADRRLAARTEDHPLDYGDFEGEIPAGQYGAGQVEIWDRGTWEPLGDPEAAMRKGDLEFVLHGHRLSGRFHLVHLKGKRDKGRQDAWFLIKGHDAFERPGVDAAALEAETSPPPPPSAEIGDRAASPAPGARRGALPSAQEPQLCGRAEEPPEGADWLSEIKFDGYRIIAAIDHGAVRLLTRKGLDWADRLPAVAQAFRALGVRTAMIDGELVALRQDGVSSFPDLQAALSAGRDSALFFYVFDLLHLNGWDLRPCRLEDRKHALRRLADWGRMLRYSDHLADSSAELRRQACRMGLEGVICKRADAPYQSGRSRDWLKVKCHGREELIVLGWTPPGGSRVGIGALHVGYYDREGRLHYAGGVGTGFNDKELVRLRERLEALAADPPKQLLVAGDPLERTIRWVRPELVAEVQFTAWSGAGRVRHPVYLGLREDKPPTEVVLDIPDPEAERMTLAPRPPKDGASTRRAPKIAVPPAPPAPAPRAGARIVVARKPRPGKETIGGVELSHADRQLWPGVTKRDLAEYWLRIADRVLPDLAQRPLALVRFPEGIDGERFFQKRTDGIFPGGVRDGSVEGSPYVALDDAAGLVAMAQMSAIELHPWGATEGDPLHPDFIVFDLDPGERVPWSEVARAALEVRERLKRLNLVSFCRTTGGKGLHVVAPLTPSLDWEQTKEFCRAFAELMSAEAPDRYVSHLKIADRHGRILVDWLRNSMGNTAIASYCPRARPGAAVATPLGWNEVTPSLEPARFTLRTIPERLATLKKDPWAGFHDIDQRLPELPHVPDPAAATPEAASRPAKRVIVTAKRPRPRR